MSNETYQIWHNLPISDESQKRLASSQAKLFGPGNVLARPDPFVGIEEADGVLITSVLRWDTNILRRAPRLKVIVRPGIGVENINLEDATRHGIAVINTPDGPTESTAEFTITLMLALLRRLVKANRTVKDGQWTNKSPDLKGVELWGKTLGLVGLGRIGGRVSEMARALGMGVLAYDPYITSERASGLGVTPVETLSDLLQQADVVSLHSPVTPETQGLMGKAEFAQMKQGTYLINCGRGALVDENALVEALQSGHLAGAALDVLCQEPPPDDHPLLQMGDEVIIAPHIASYTVDGIRKMEQVAVQGILDALNGKRPQHLLNPEVWPNVK